MPGPICYAKNGTISLAFQIDGEGPFDLLFAQGWVTNLEYAWENPDLARFLRRLASFSRLIRFDKRGMGLSDRDVSPATLEQRADDIGAVLDAAGSQKAVLFGVSEGGYMSVMYAATHPERVSALVLYGCFAKQSWSEDYPWGTTPAQRNAWIESVDQNWGGPFDLEVVAPSMAHDEAARSWFGTYLRNSASPGMVRAISDINFSVDVRPVLPSISCPTLVLHRTGDRWFNLAEGRYLAEHIPSAQFIELPGDDHIAYWGDQDRLLDEIQHFLTGTRDRPPTGRVLVTILVTDIVGSTQRVAQLGDRKWQELLAAHDAVVRRQLHSFSGHEINTTGDGFMLAFDGPSRAIQCAHAIRRSLASLGVNIRAGLHVGECERVGSALTGLALHIAARIADLAGPGDVLVSSMVRDLVAGSDCKFEARGAFELKGVPGTWTLSTVSVN